MSLAPIKAEYANTMNQIQSYVESFPWENRQAYAQWLAQSYYFVRHSTRLLAFAAAHAPFSKNQTHRRMSEHIAEEIGHEMLAANDLKNLGFSIDEFIEFSETQKFYQFQYQGIEGKTPTFLMGYILFLEGLAVVHGPHMLERIVKAHGKGAARFLKLHVEEDQDHIESAFNNIEIERRADSEGVLESLRYSFATYASILGQCEKVTQDFKEPQAPSASV